MTFDAEIFQADFDRLAAYETAAWNHNTHYHAYLLRHAPARMASALDVGCGAGRFTRLLAQRADAVTGLDLSPNMIQLARERSASVPHVAYEVADVMQLDLPTNDYDCIASIATLHHLPLADVLGKLKAALKPSGVLLVLDLYVEAGPVDALYGLLSMPWHAWLARRHRAGASSAAARAAWELHGQHDVYMPLREIRRTARAVLPGAQVRRLLLWRYALVWRKPG